MENILFGVVTPCNIDLELLKKIGLPSYQITNHDELYLGEYKSLRSSNATIKVWITCMPAQFYTFEILNDEGIIFIVKTGTGHLYTFWQSIVLIAEGLLDIRRFDSLHYVKKKITD